MRDNASDLDRRGFSLALLLAILVGVCAGLGVFLFAPPVVDEWPNAALIVQFLKGQLGHHPNVVTLPGYHLTMAGTARIFGLTTLMELRLASLAWSLLAVVAFYLVARRLTPKDAPLRAVQFLFLPFAFPFFFILYTDVFALLPLFVAFGATLSRRPRLAGIAATLSMAVRQSHVVWLVFLLLIHLATPEEEDESGGLLARLREAWTFLLGLALFGTFVVWNGGVAMSRGDAHPSGSFHFGNIFLSLLAFAVLFLPIVVSEAKSTFERIRERPLWLLLPAVVGAVYFATFRLDHPNNLLRGFVHNELLAWMAQSLSNRALAFVPMAAALLTVPGLKLLEPRFRWLYPCWFLSLVPLWLVEPRYQLPALALFLLVRRPGSRWLEGTIVGGFVALDAALLYVAWQGWLFL